MRKLARVCLRATPLKVRGEKFTNVPKSAKFAKVFSLKSFPLYSIYKYLSFFITVSCCSCYRSVEILIFHSCRLWFNFHKPAHDPISTFNIHRDDIYVAVILFGIGGTALSVVALTLVSLLVGEYSVRNSTLNSTACPTSQIPLCQ